MSAPINADDFTTEQQKTDNNINELDSVSNNLTSQLTQSSTMGESNKNNDLVNDINQLQNTQNNLLDEKTQNYSDIAENIQGSYDETMNQTTLAAMVQSEMERSKNSIQDLTDAKNNKLRMIQLNTYQREKNNANIQLLQYVIVLCICILFLSILSNRNILSGSLYSTLMSLVIAVGLIMIVRKVRDINSRDPLIFSRYKHDFDAVAAAAANANSSNKDDSDSGFFPCYGANCCEPNAPEPTVYVNGKCVVKGSKSDTSSSSGSASGSSSSSGLASGSGSDSDIPDADSCVGWQCTNNPIGQYCPPNKQGSGGSGYTCRETADGDKQWVAGTPSNTIEQFVGGQNIIVDLGNKNPVEAYSLEEDNFASA